MKYVVDIDGTICSPPENNDYSKSITKLKISNKVILDPFCGSGTLLIEASKQNKNSVPKM